MMNNQSHLCEANEHEQDRTTSRSPACIATWVVLVALFALTGCVSSKGLFIAIKRNDTNKTYHEIMRGADVNSKSTESRMTPLMYAADKGNLDIIKMLLGQGARANEKGPDGCTALHIAAILYANQQGNAKKISEKAEIVRLLINSGADVNVRCASGDTPLHNAAANGFLDGMHLLINAGADADSRNRAQVTPLHLVALKGTETAARLLLEKGVDVNAETNRSVTPLANAAQNGHREIVALLLHKGARKDVRINNPRGWENGYTAAMLAEKNGNDDIVRMLQSGATAIAARVQAKEQRPMEAQKPVPPAAPIVAPERPREPSGEVSTPAVAAIAVTPAVPSPARKADVDIVPVTTRKAGNAYAVVIGIEKYRQKMQPADFAANDARVVSDYLVNSMGYPEENVITLINENATKGDFEKYFERWLGNNVEKDSTVFVYYSGHGAPNPASGDAYLVPYDGDAAFLEQTGYSLRRIYESLQKLPAREVIVALDSCFSGAGGRSIIAKGARPLVMNLKTAYVPSENMVVLSASSGEQISSTYEEKEHGLFTYFLLKGLKGGADSDGDGGVTVDELFSYIKPQVERIAIKKYNNVQTPQLFASGAALEKKKLVLVEGLTQ